MAKECPIKVNINDEYYIFEAQGQFSLMRHTQEMCHVPGKRRRQEVTKKKATYHVTLEGCINKLAEYEWEKKEAKTVKQLKRACAEVTERLEQLTEQIRYVTKTNTD